MDHGGFKEILKVWGLDFRRKREDLALPGSPERCLFRTVVETMDARRFVLERIAPAQHARRTEMGATLHALRGKGLGKIQEYLPDLQGAYVARCGRDLWQISPYVEGTPLVRSGYISDGWRGRLLADFLADMKRAAAPGLPTAEGKPFSILRFTDDLQEKLRRHDPDILEQIGEIVRFLHRNFTDAHDRLPVIFCHGDLHPLNVIWSADGIACVIDWEFMGYKQALYDAANLIGCVGMEDPKGLTAPLVRDFLLGLRKAAFLPPPDLRFLPEAVIALRFAWLSEWLRKGDREMVELEIVYLKLLKGDIDLLRKAWETGGN
jgi:homoserine kinase type II